MVKVDDNGGGRPTLDPKAKHYERELYKVWQVSMADIFNTQSEWQLAQTQLEELSKDVRKVRRELQSPADGGKGWTGPAAEAALASLKKLSDTLDGHAVDIGKVDTSLDQVNTAVSDAMTAWFRDVASVSTQVDPQDFQTRPMNMAPTADPQFGGTDHKAMEAAEDALWEKRNQAAKKILKQLVADAKNATGTMPISTTDGGGTPYTNTGGDGGGTDYPTNTTTHHDTGVTTTVIGPDNTDDPDDPVDPDDPDPNDTPTDPVWPPVPDPDPDDGPSDTIDDDPISSDGDPTGSTGLPTVSADSSAGGGAGGSDPSGPGTGTLAAGGVGAGAAGIGGLLGARGGGGLFGSRTGLVPGGSGSPATGARGAAGSRSGAGSGPRPGGSTAARGAQVVPTNGQAGRASGARTSAVKGATGSGRYGVPRLGTGKGSAAVPVGSGQPTKSGDGRGPAGRKGGAAAAAGARGGSRKGERTEVNATDQLTREDEETWYDGTEECSPQVWQ